MKHFFDYINSSKFDLDKLSRTNVLVTLKIDGTALQLCFDSDKATFHKRSNDVSEKGPQISRIDAFNNPAYYDTMKYLNPIIKDNVGKFNGIKILNSEIIIDSNPHLIQYNQKPKGNLCLLGGISSNGKSIDPKMIDEYATILGVESVPVFFKGKLGDKMNQILDYVKNYCDPHNPIVRENFKNDIISILGNNSDSLMLDTKNGYIEGFVFDFSDGDSHTLLKIDDPSFVIDFKKMKDKEMSDSEKSKMDEVLNDIFNYFQSKGLVFKKQSNDIFENLLKNFDIFCSKDSSFIDYLYNEGKSCKMGEFLIYSNDVSILPKRYANKKNDDKFFFSLRVFTWIFGKKRKGENFPILQKLGELVR